MFELPEDFMFKDCTTLSMLNDNYVKCNKTIFILRHDKTVNKITSDKKIYLPSVEIEILVKNVSVTTIEAKYKEHIKKMQKTRSSLLNFLKQTGITNTIVNSENEIVKGNGVYFYINWMSQSAENNCISFREKFSVVWSTGRIITGSDSLVTFH